MKKEYLTEGVNNTDHIKCSLIRHKDPLPLQVLNAHTVDVHMLFS